MANQADKSFNFSAKLEELDKITNSLDGDVELDKGIKQYEEGMKLIQELKAYLSEQTNKVEEIKKAYGAAAENADEVDDFAAIDEPGDARDIDLDTIPF